MKEKLYHFMSGRYGNDAFNTFLLISYFVLSFFVRKSTLISSINFLLFVFAFYRCMSKNIYKRRHENEIFLRFIQHFRPYWQVIKNNIKDKQRKYFVCPTCKQVVRVPKHHGKIEITCPSCRTCFTRKS